MPKFENGRQRSTPTYGSLTIKTGTAKEVDIEIPINNQRLDLLRGANSRIIFALSLCTLIFIVETIGGILSGSLAILADAGHLLTDIITYLISLTSIWLSKKPPSKSFTYGLLRAEVLGALFSIFLSFGLAIALTYFAILRIVNPDFKIDGLVMLIIGVVNFLGIIQLLQLQFGFCCCTNLTDGDEEDLLLQSHGHSHVHGHSHSLPCCGGSGDDDISDHMNVRAACLHIFGDSIFGFGLLVGALIIYFKPEYKILDPILTIIFGVIVLLTLFGLFRDSVYILMAGKPSGLDYDDAKSRLVEIDGVEDVHSLRIWSLTPGVALVCAHLVSARYHDGRPVDAPKILREARHILETKFHVHQSTIQIEMVDNELEFLCARTIGIAA